MNIAPVMQSNYSNIAKMNFKGKNKENAGAPDSGSNKDSKQNNSHEIYISPESYFNMMAAGMTDKIFEDSKNPESEFSKVQNGFDEIMEADEYYDDIEAMVAENSASMALYTIKAAAEQIGQAPDELKDKIPLFSTSSADKYIRNMERNIAQQETVNYSEVRLPDLEDMNNNPKMDKYSDMEKEAAADMLDKVQAMFDDGTMQEILEAQKAVVEVLKTSKHDELQEALDAVSESINYIIYRAVCAGFDRDPRNVINILTTNEPMHTKPIVENNNNGTSTYTYPSMFSTIKVVRNNANGDYISAEGIKNGQRNFSVNFREDGSIDELYYFNSLDNSKLCLSTNPNGNKLTVKQLFSEKDDSAITLRTFERQKDNTLNLTSMRTLMR